MAVIPAVRSSLVPNVVKIEWETLTEADTAEREFPQGLEPLAGAFQVTGTFGGATVVLQGSNDGSNWATLSDPQGDAISLTGAGIFEFSTSVAYIRPAASGGTGQDVDVTIILRNQ